MTFVKFPSHRARQYALRELRMAGLLTEPLQGYYSYDRSLHHGCYEMSDAQVNAIETSSCRLVHFTKLRGPFTDLIKCH
jgi:hypothetical protein